MTTRNQYIKEHVGRHIDFRVRRSDEEEKGHYMAHPASPYEWTILDYRSDCCEWFATEDEGYLHALDAFLGNPEYTGARIQDLCDHGPGKEIGPVKVYGTCYFDNEDPTNEDKHWRGYCTYASDAYLPTGDAKTVDESVADLWRQVFIDQEQP